MTTKSDIARRRARAFLEDSGVDRVPPDLRGKVLDAYLVWVGGEPKAPATLPPGTLAVLSAELPDAGPEGSTHLELPCRVEGTYMNDLRLVVVPLAEVPVGYRQALTSSEGWWATTYQLVTVATQSQLRLRASGPGEVTPVEVWDPMAVVLRMAAPWTVGDEVDERLRRDVSGFDEDDDEDGWGGP